MIYKMGGLSLTPKRPDLPVSFQRHTLQHSRDKERLKESCQAFEGILLGMVWKGMFNHARSLDGEDERPFGVLEDLAIEMSAESMSKSGGVGLWKVLYAQLVEGLPSEGPNPESKP